MQAQASCPLELHEEPIGGQDRDLFSLGAGAISQICRSLTAQLSRSTSMQYSMKTPNLASSQSIQISLGILSVQVGPS
jgi:hypothetical protein